MENNCIIKPLITEKSMEKAAKGKFTFVVEKDSAKTEIKKEIEKRFKVHVLGISTSIVKGKKIKTGKRRTEVTRSSWKKATLTLKPGEKIELFEVSGQ